MVERRVEVAKLLVAQRPLGQSYAPVSQGVATEPGIGESGVEFVKPDFRVVMQGDKAVKLKARLGVPDLQDLAPGVFAALDRPFVAVRSEAHTSELQSLMRISFAVFCLK